MKKKKIEFSKIILVFAALTDLCITAYACYMIYMTRDTSLFAYIIPAKAAELATGTAFYYNKAKKENLRKITNQLITDFADKYGIEIVMQMVSNMRDY